ncbi:MAG TPA: DUF1735 domain-containing protein [Chryseosolibacter sp.]|nr:DUF1735 domain-containing protein [Chryseosolibacter sp.]
MKKILLFLVLILAASACYDDYVLDYDFEGIYFPYQQDVRTFVVGEGMKIKFGIALGGVRENNRDRVVNYQIDNSLVSPATLALMQGSSSTYIKNSVGDPVADPGFQLKLLPADYYTLSDDSKIVIEKGQHSGTVTVIPDSAAFLSDPETLMATYVLPLRLIGADAAEDSILSTKDFAVIGLKYENMLFGNYWHGGVTVEKDPGGNVINTTTYYTTIPSAEAQVWRLKTVEPFALTIDGVSNISSSDVPEMKITMNGGDIQVSAMPGATFQVEPDGASVFNQPKLLQDRKIFLNYKYVNGAGNTCYATDTLTFRNRIRDGINEWQDENPSHYE